MSEEEIIKEIIFMAKWFPKLNLIKERQAIQGLLDLYNKEKEKYIFEKVAKEEVEELLEDSISKDKIREKIEEYKKPKKFKEVDEYGEIIEGEIIYKDIVEALKKLLKEE